MKIFFIADALSTNYSTLLTTATKLGIAVAKTAPVYLAGAYLSDTQQDIVIHSIGNSGGRDQFMLSPASYDLIIIEPQPELSSYSFNGYPSGAAICAKIISAQLSVLFLTEIPMARLQRGVFKNYDRSYSYPMDQLDNLDVHATLRAMVDAHRYRRAESARMSLEDSIAANILTFPIPPTKRAQFTDKDTSPT